MIGSMTLPSGKVVLGDDGKWSGGRDPVLLDVLNGQYVAERVEYAAGMPDVVQAFYDAVAWAKGAGLSAGAIEWPAWTPPEEGVT